MNSMFFPVLIILCYILDTCTYISGYVRRNPRVSVRWGRPKNEGGSQSFPLATVRAFGFDERKLSHSFPSQALQLFEGMG